MQHTRGRLSIKKTKLHKLFFGGNSSVLCAPQKAVPCGDEMKRLLLALCCELVTKDEAEDTHQIILFEIRYLLATDHSD